MIFVRLLVTFAVAFLVILAFSCLVMPLFIDYNDSEFGRAGQALFVFYCGSVFSFIAALVISIYYVIRRSTVKSK
jgi:hypothetical protein